MSETGERTVNLIYSLARVDARSSAGDVPVAALLVGQIDRAMRFTVASAVFPLGPGGLAEADARALAEELEAAMAVHVDAVLCAAGSEQTLSAPAQTLHAALRTSQLKVGAIRPERTLSVRLCDALSTSREIVRQHLLHEQSRFAPGATTCLDVEREFGPIRIDSGAAGSTLQQ